MNTENLCMGCMREKAEGVAKCLRCGYVEGSPYLPSYLAPKTVLADRYLVGKILSYNGSGATYIAFDIITGTKVKIREYMPENLASREKGNPQVKANAGSEIQYKSLKMDFMDLAKNLVKLNSLSEVEHINDTFEANNTFYIVYEFIEGMTLSEFLKKNGGYLSWEDTKQLFMPLLSCVNAIHTSELIHRGISPETIIVDRSGNLKLTAFDIAPARTARSELVAQLFPGYSAPEQYTSSAWQGAYTDVYALASCIYRALTGTMPVEAISRVSSDNLVAASALNPSIPQNVSNALNSAMALSPEKRTKNVSGLISQLSEVADFGAAVAVSEVDEEVKETKTSDKKKMKESTKYMLIAAAVAVPVIVVILIILMSTFGSSSGGKDNSSSSEPAHVFSSTGAESEETSSKPIYLYSVPNFVSKNIKAIEADDDYREKFSIKTEYEYNETYGANIIYDQSVAAGTPIEENGTEIILKVSLGSKYYELDDFAGKNLDFVKNTLYSKDIRYTVETRQGEYGDPQEVIATDPAPGTLIDISTRTPVTIYVYDKEPEPEPEPEPDLGWGEGIE